MKKLIGWILLILFSMGILFFISKNNKEYSIVCNDKAINVELKYKGLENSIDFTKDEKGNFYIAFKNKLVVIEQNGKSYILHEDSNLEIYNVEYFNNTIYIASKDKVLLFNLFNKEITECIQNIPNYGDYKNTLLKIKGDYLFVTVGSATNSGVVGPDNTWTEQYPDHHDISPKKITLRGNNFGPSNNGAYVAKDIANIKNQIIEGNNIGNSTVIIYNLKSKAYETFAWGIRNIKGMDFSSEGKIYATVGGIEERGLRPIYNDTDYIYEIKKGIWHGFPDYSGGDPVTSPRFSDDNGNVPEFIMEKHPSNNPPSPSYQHSDISTLGPLCIDSKAVLKNKDKMYFYDKKNNKILSLSNKEKAKEFISLGDKSNIAAIKIIDDEMLMLENKEGVLYSLTSKEPSIENNIKNKVYLSLLVVVITLIVSIIILNMKNYK